ncbi:MAG: undecaprenyl-diphosphate phosphatase [Candidatus Nealsonbacteria bacterium CG08_land_8_20_14_0_20_43_11]|uniref:Undecaprenyl-diphosphatase n=1 Tax=Candidatus Nealsonbacteria bacterium CG08_land_8_20_14_0_20_43_11 TaxID=1974706 RepID=A0A2M6T0J9_9BACT|nr:MAG: undecaprenyl-diphosphate phosphatase [Candidatus Nealsonbacteria bacterium CG08_land_8_20_14_0_20_43_11]
MNFFQAVILGVVEGLTEFLPISSTGHLVLASQFLKIPSTDFLKSFEIAIQLGAILAVVFLYWQVFLKNKEAVKRVLVAFLPTAILGVILYKAFKSFLGSTNVVLWALFLGGIFLLVFERFHKEKQDGVEEIAAISYFQAFLIGGFQAVAMIPGVSRAAATIVAGLFLGLKRKTIVEFSFLLAVPTILAATAFDLMRNASGFLAEQFTFLALGFGVSFLAALLSVKFLLAFVKKHTFVSFGVYRIILAALFWLLVQR